VRLDHLLSKEHLHPSPAYVRWGDSSLVEHWLLNQAVIVGLLVPPVREWERGFEGSGWLDTLLGPEETGMRVRFFWSTGPLKGSGFPGLDAVAVCCLRFA
jgi:hypothetical protein